MQAAPIAQEYLEQALKALGSRDADFHDVIDAMPVPVYLTDADGLVTHWNRACVELAGREPQLGKDRWCVTWKLYTTADEPLPHDQCPMAVAIRERHEVRGEIAIALRPDGSRRALLPYPTPLFDDDGELAGAINLLIDVSEEQAEALHRQADRCHRLASAVCDHQIAELLDGMAKGYQRNAAALRSS